MQEKSEVRMKAIRCKSTFISNMTSTADSLCEYNLPFDVKSLGVTFHWEHENITPQILILH